MAVRIREFDWARTPLGSVGMWSDRLKLMVEQLLASPLVATLACGPERTLIYNDTAARLFGDHHPAALGRPLPETFQEGWATVAPFYERAFAGETVQVGGQPLDTRGEGEATDVFDALLMPVREVDGEVAYVHMTGSEISARARSEADLRASETRYRNLFEAIDEGFCTIEVLFDDEGRANDYRFLSVNAAFTQQTGLGDAVGRTMKELVPEHEAHWFETYGRIVRTGQPERFEDRADALGRWYDVYACRLGTVEQAQVAVLFKDVLARKRDEQRVRESEERFRAFVTASSDVIYRMSPDWSEMRALDGRGFLTDTVSPRKAWLSAYIDPADEPQVMIAIQNAIRSKAMFELEHRVLRVDGRMGWALSRAVPLLDEAGVIREWFGTATDVTARKETQEALRVSEARLAAVFEGLPVGVGVTDVEGRFVLLNERMRRYVPTGIMPSRDEERQSRWRAWHPDGRPVEPQDFPGARALRGERIIPGLEMLYADDEGQEVWTSVTGVPLIDQDGDVVGQLGVVADINAARQAAEAQRRNGERQAFLLRLGDALRLLADPVQIMTAASEALGRHLDVGRCSYGEVDASGEFFIVERDWTDGIMASFRGKHRLVSFGPEFTEAYRAGRSVMIGDALADARAAGAEAVFEAAGSVRASLGLPLIKDGRFVAGLFVQQLRPRQWTARDEVLTRDVAERTWAAVERARAEAALSESKERFAQFAASSSDALWIRDAATLTMEYTSPAIQTIYGIDPDAILGDIKRWVELIVLEDRETALHHIKQAQAGSSVTHEFRIRRSSDGALRWIRNTDFPLRDQHGQVLRVGGIAQDVTEAKRGSERLEVLVNELQHRSRNLLGVVTSLANRTVGRGSSAESFLIRLKALSRAQALLSQGGSDTVAVEALVRAELAAHADSAPDHIVIDGPVVRLTSRQVQNFALALHELTTNAVKYGALKDGTGRLSVTWELIQTGGGRHLALTWVETGVDVPPEAVMRRGYGRELIEQALAYALGGRTDYVLDPGGVRCRIELPIV